MKGMGQRLGAATMCGILLFNVIGCSNAPEPTEESIEKVVSTSPRTADANGFFMRVCPWGTYYSFCSEDKAQSKSASDGCENSECQEVSRECYATECMSGLGGCMCTSGKAVYDCGGHEVYTDW
jgi:hypothetical protein